MGGALPGGLDGNESACNAGELGSIPGLGRSPGEGDGYPLQYSCLENSPGQKSLVGYSPLGPNILIKENSSLLINFSINSNITSILFLIN